MDEFAELDIKTRAALTYDLIDKIDMAITSLDLKTVREVRCLLLGMKDGAKDALK